MAERPPELAARDAVEEAPPGVDRPARLGALGRLVPRRQIVLATEARLALVSAGLGANALLGRPRVWALYLLATLGAALWAFHAPALRSLAPRLVREDQYAAISALQSVSGSLGAVVGPAAGGLLIAAVGLPTAFLIDVASFGASLVAAALLPAVRPVAGVGRPAPLDGMLGALRFVRRRRVLLGSLLLDSNAMIFGMPQALFTAIALHRRHGDAGTVGLLYGAPSAGALAAAALSGWIGGIRRRGVAIAAFASAWGGAIALSGLSATLWASLVLLALAGAADRVSATLRSTVLLEVTPDAMRGRLSGIELAQVASTPALGNLEAGAVAAFTSLRFSVVSGGLAVIAGSALILAAIPELVRYEARRPRG